MYVSCKQIVSYFLSLKYVNIDFRFSFDRSPRTLTENNRRVESHAIWKVRGQKRKSVTHTLSEQFTASVSLSWAVTWGSAWCHPLHPCRSAWRVFRSYSCYQENPRYLTLSVWAWRHACTAQRPTLSVSREPLPTVCLYSQVPFFSSFFLAVPCLLFATDLGLLGY